MERRRQLAAVLAGATPAGEIWDGEAAWLQCAWDEGVVALLSTHLERLPAPDSLRAACREHAKGLALAELVRRAELRHVLDSLARAGIAPLLLKGTALGQWLYPAPYLRESSDVDLLFASRADAERAATVLAGRGYAVPFVPGRFAHELACRSGDRRSPDLDLHWQLSDWPSLDRLPDFPTLQAAAIPLHGLGPHARGLSAEHALLHACVHRASNLLAGLGDRLKWLYDLHLLAAALDQAGWARFVQACLDSRTCGICAEGLAAAVDLFDTRVPTEVEQALARGRASEPLDARRLADWRYLQQLNLRALPGWRMKLSWIWSRVLPPAGYMRELYGTGHGRLGLLWMRLSRGLWRFSRRAPDGPDA